MNAEIIIVLYLGSLLISLGLLLRFGVLSTTWRRVLIACIVVFIIMFVARSMLISFCGSGCHLIGYTWSLAIPAALMVVFIRRPTVIPLSAAPLFVFLAGL